MKVAALLLLLSVAVAAQVKKPEPPAVKVPFAESLQAVVVVAKTWDSKNGSARLFSRKNLRSKWRREDIELSVVLGRSGLAWAQDSAPESATEFKKEGDGKSPAGMFPLTFAFGRSKSNGVKLPFRRLEDQTECVDDVHSTHYNKIVGRLQVGVFDWKSSEKMATITPEYDLGVFVGYNSFPVVKGNGSCIFLHVWKDAQTPTSGCTAMAPVDMERIVAWLDPQLNPYLVQLPNAEYSKYQKAWNLPTFK